MSSVKFTDPDHWNVLEAHMTGGRGERFAFAHTRSVRLGPEPIVEVVAVELIDDMEVSFDDSGWHLADDTLDRVHNAAIVGDYGLIEFHNHQLGPPAFSRTDEAGLKPMAAYVTSLMPDRLYGAGVYADGRVHVEHWTRHNEEVLRGRFRSVSIVGDQLRLVNATSPTTSVRLSRQESVLGAFGAQTLAGLRVAIVGAGGTGSYAALTLAYLGIRDMLIFDDDLVEVSNLNRLVTAVHADLGAPKNLVTRRRIREIDPDLHVVAMGGIEPHGGSPELDDVDLIVGCIDHDGPRDLLNQIAVDTATPYIDIATGVLTNPAPTCIGGRVILVTPGGPCLHCLGELDPGEISRWSKSPTQQALDRQHGYGTQASNPAIVHLNGLAVNAAIAELVAWIAGHRRPAQFVEIDLTGNLARSGAPSGVRVAPRQPVAKTMDCFSCHPAR